MSQVYVVTFENITIATADGDQDLFELTPADDRGLAILGLTLDQMSDVGDAAEEILRLKIIRGHVTAGTGGTLLTPVPVDPRSAAAGFAADRNNTGIASTGTPVDLWAGAFNIRVGLQLWFPPEVYPRIDQGQSLLVVRLMAAPVDDVTMSGSLYVMEG